MIRDGGSMSTLKHRRSLIDIRGDERIELGIVEHGGQFTPFFFHPEEAWHGDHEELPEEQWTSRMVHKRDAREENVKSLFDRVTPLKPR